MGESTIFRFLLFGIVLGGVGLVAGMLTGAVVTIVSSKYRYYNFSKYSDAKKKWLLTKMIKFASL